MLYEVKKINIFSAARVISLALGGLTLVISLFAFFLASWSDGFGFSLSFLTAPLLALLLGYILGLLAAGIYNLVALYEGGLEIELKEKKEKNKDN